MALFGVPGYLSTVEWTAWQLVTDEHSRMHSDTLASRVEPMGLWCPQERLMTQRAIGATDGPSLNHTWPSVSWLWFPIIYLFTPLRAFTHLHAEWPLLDPFFLHVIDSFFFSKFEIVRTNHWQVDFYAAKIKNKKKMQKRSGPFTGWMVRSSVRSIHGDLLLTSEHCGCTLSPPLSIKYGAHSRLQIAVLIKRPTPIPRL